MPGPVCDSFSPPVIVTAAIVHPSPASLMISTTGAPTPVASTATMHCPRSRSCVTTARTRSTTSVYGVPSAIRSACRTSSTPPSRSTTVSAE